MDHNNIDTHVHNVGDQKLLHYVQQLLPKQPFTILERTTERVYGGTFGTIYRFQGKAKTNTEIFPWSLILKVVRLSNSDSIDRSQPNNQRYWKREPLAYQSGFLAQLPGPLVAPRCFDIIQYTDNEFWLWLEDVTETTQVSWSTERYRRMAQHIGQFSGAGLQNKNWLDQSWLGKDMQRAQGREMESVFMEQLPEVQHDLLVQRFMSNDTYQRIMRLWQDREHFYANLDRLPQTVCHRDACYVNLFSRQKRDGTIQTVAIDWEDVSLGAVGEDLVALVVISLMSNHIDFSDSLAFEASVFESYLQGLRDSGWNGEPGLVRLGYTAAFIRYGLGLVHFIVGFAVDEQNRTRFQERMGKPIEEIADQWANLYRFILGRTDEARNLMTHFV